jgi:hypothetical protein
MDESCRPDSSGISEKSIVFDLVTFPFLATRPPRADDPRDFFIVLSPHRIGYSQNSTETALREPQAARFGFRVLQVFTVQAVRIKKRGGRFLE